MAIPVSEIEIDEALIYNLLEEQHPDLKHLPIHLVDAGWDNTKSGLTTPFILK